VLGLVTAGMGKLRSYEIPEPAVSIVEKGEEVAAAG
jgi:hypothetical protein